MGVYAIHWTEVTVTDRSTGVWERYTEHSWSRFHHQILGGTLADLSEWEESGERWAHVFVDWAGPDRLEDAMEPLQVLEMAKAGLGGYRLVAAGRDTGLAVAGEPLSPATTEWRSKAAATPARGDLPGQGSFAW